MRRFRARMSLSIRTRFRVMSRCNATPFDDQILAKNIRPNKTLLIQAHISQFDISQMFVGVSN
jgi:hypothetical protein